MAKTLNDLLDAAIKEEIAAKKYYYDARDKTEVAKLKEFFNTLANDEKGHERILSGVKEMELYDGLLLVDEELVNNIEGAHQIPDEKPIDEMNIEEAMEVAIKKENKANKVYTHMAEMSPHEELNKLFSSLASDEKRHADSIERNYKIHTGQMGWEQ